MAVEVSSTVMLLFSLLSLSLHLPAVHGGTPLFVFGDSYADTGNHDADDPSLSGSWKTPYGLTWPGKPAGRFSDGHILTDFIAGFLGVPSPVPYREIEEGNGEKGEEGVNFAFGGSGVFETYGPQFPNISLQIDEFERLLKSCCQDRISSSYVLFVYAGNDYSAHIRKTGNTKGMSLLIVQVLKQLTDDLQRLYKLGVRRFAVTNLEPAGCLPFLSSMRDFTACNRTDNVLAALHNRLLSASLARLRSLGAHITLLDLHQSFLNVFKSPSLYGIMAKPLEPCCSGIDEKNVLCGTVDGDGKPLYKVCSDPTTSFFWDLVHPTQAGWKAIAEQYKGSFV